MTRAKWTFFGGTYVRWNNVNNEQVFCVRSKIMESSTMTKHVRETRVLVLYTGGTIGMKKTDGGELSREDFDRRLIVAHALRADVGNIRLEI